MITPSEFSQRQTYYYHLQVESKNNSTNALIYKTRYRLTDTGNKLNGYQKGKVGRDTGGILGGILHP